MGASSRTSGRARRQSRARLRSGRSGGLCGRGGARKSAWSIRCASRRSQALILPGGLLGLLGLFGLISLTKLVIIPSGRLHSYIVIVSNDRREVGGHTAGTDHG